MIPAQAIMLVRSVFFLCVFSGPWISLAAQDCAAVIAGPNPIRVCPGSVVELNGSGSVPSGSGSSLEFQWVFEDGTSASVTDTSYLFAHSGFRTATLIVLDDAGCVDSSAISVEVSPTADFWYVPNQMSCLGDTALMRARVEQRSYYRYLVQPTLIVDNDTTMFTLAVDRFEPEDQINSPSDISTICVDMEHSHMGDLQVRLTCPNGNSMLLQQLGGGQTDLGDTYWNAPPTSPGGCWQYCWAPDATLGTWAECASNGPTPNVVNTYEALSLRPGTYSSIEPFSNLIGCPKNGEWNLSIIDNSNGANGFLCDWSLQFEGEDITSPDTSNVRTITAEIEGACEAWVWSGPDLLAMQEPCDTARAWPQEVGVHVYTLMVTDNSGCVHLDERTLEVLDLRPEVVGPISVSLGVQVGYTVAEVRPGMSYTWTGSSNQIYNWQSPNVAIVFNSLENNWIAVREYNQACLGRDTLFIERIVSVPENIATPVTAYPNPADGSLNISFAEPLPRESRIRVYDTFGRQVHKVEPSFGTEHYTVPTSNLPSGSYVLEIMVHKNRRVLPFVVQHLGGR